MKVKITILLLFIIFLSISMYPMETIVVPEVRIKVADETGSPAIGALVKQEWRDWSVESEDHYEYSRTDADGYFFFPKRAIQASLFERFLGTIWAYLSQGIHASVGSSATIWVQGDASDVWSTFHYSPKKIVPDKIELKKRLSPISL